MKMSDYREKILNVINRDYVLILQHDNPLSK